MSTEAMRKALEEARAMVDAVRSGGGGIKGLAAHADDLETAICAALAAPQAQPEAGRVGLTDEQMLACIRSILVPRPMGLTRDRGPYEVTEPTHYLRLLVAAIERAHGIPAAKAEG